MVVLWLSNKKWYFSEITTLNNVCLKLQVQGKDPSVDFTQEVVDESEEERFEEVNDSNLWVELPPCELGKLDQINEVS